MSWFTNAMSSTLGRKIMMSLTGLFLILFLTGHLVGNLQLFMLGEEGQLQFNAYAKFMTTNPAVKILSYLTYISIVAHVIYSIVLTRHNKAARGSDSYAYEKASASSTWSSRNMGILGTIVLIFIVVHMKGFWAEMHWGGLPLDSAGNKDLHTLVVKSYTEGLDPIPGIAYALFYVVCMGFVAFHLSHGFSSAFQTLGLNHSKYSPLIKKIGMAYAILVPILFAAMPLYIYVMYS